ncbi:MobA/MobL family protein [Blautia sp.]|uniref:MobA/MobL family protein n=1 Tax=Blautia sp. TaxID=1955243 RepID=UPI003AB772C1
MLPEGAPGEYLDPERLFNAVEMAEKRSDARPAKKIIYARSKSTDRHAAMQTAAKGIRAFRKWIT